MTRPECPNCLWPRATTDDEIVWDSIVDNGAPKPPEWPDEEGSHLCWVDFGGECQRAEGYDLSPAEIRDLINERDVTRDELATTAGVAAEQEAEIRDLRAGFAAAWAEVEQLESQLITAEGILSDAAEWMATAGPVGTFLEDCRPLMFPADGEATAKNFATAFISFPDGTAGVLTLQRIGGKTPPEILAEKDAEIARLARERDEALTDADLQRQAVTYEAAAANTLRRERDEAQAAGAVMRKALTAIMSDHCVQVCRALIFDPECSECLAGAALASNAGRPLLDRLEKAEARADKAEADMQAMRAERDAALAMAPPFAAAEARANNAEAGLQRERERADGILRALRMLYAVAGHHPNLFGTLRLKQAEAALGKDPTHEPG